MIADRCAAPIGIDAQGQYTPYYALECSIYKYKIDNNLKKRDVFMKKF